MIKFYLAPLIGDGSEENPFRAKGADEAVSYGMIDFPDSPFLKGVCLAGYDWKKVPNLRGMEPIFTDKVLAVRDVPIINYLNSVFKCNCDGNNLPEYIFNLLSVVAKSRPDISKPLRSPRLYLGNKLIYGSPPPIRKRGTITESFDGTSGSIDDGNCDLTWVEVDDGFERDGSGRCVSTGTAAAYADESEPTSDDHYAQADAWVTGTPRPAVVARFETVSDYDWYDFRSDCDASAWKLYRHYGGAFLALSTYSTGWAAPNGNTLYIEADGSSQVGKEDGDTKCSASDSNISGFTNVGIRCYQADGEYDSFEAADLGAAPAGFAHSQVVIC